MSQNRSSAVMQQRATTALDVLDDFPTPPWATRALFEYVLLPIGGRPEPLTAWEPAANRGYMAKVLKEYIGLVMASDVHDYDGLYGTADFLIPGTEPPLVAMKGVDAIITNPPFVQAQRFIHRAIGIKNVRIVAMLVRTSFLEGVERYKQLYQIAPPTFVAQFAERVIMLKGVLRDPDKRYWDGTQWRKPSTATSYCWLVWVKGMTPQPFVHIPPCRKLLTRPGDYPANPDEEGIFTPPQEGNQWHMDETTTQDTTTSEASEGGSDTSPASTTSPSGAGA